MFLEQSFPKIELSLVPSNKLNPIGLLIGMILLCVIGYGVYQYLKLDKESRQITDEISRVRNSFVSTSHGKLQLNDMETKALNDAYKKLNYAWDRPFKALEKARMPEVSILEVQPNIDKQEFEVAAQATSLQAMLDYTKKLRELPFVRRVVLKSKETLDDQYQPVLFSYTLAWY